MTGLRVWLSKTVSSSTAFIISKRIYLIHSFKLELLSENFCMMSSNIFFCVLNYHLEVLNPSDQDCIYNKQNTGNKFVMLNLLPE